MQRVHAPESVLTPEYARSVILFIMPHPGAAVLEDLTQDALLHGLRAFRRVTEIQHPKALFVKIVRDTIRDYWRQHRALVPIDSINPGRMKVILNLDERLDRSKRLNQIKRTLSRLTLQERKLIELFYLEGISIIQLSAMVGKSQSAVKMSLLRGRNK